MQVVVLVVRMRQHALHAVDPLVGGPVPGLERASRLTVFQCEGSDWHACAGYGMSDEALPGNRDPAVFGFHLAVRLVDQHVSKLEHLWCADTLRMRGEQRSMTLNGIACPSQCYLEPVPVEPGLLH